jgi:predicted dehydrogenase
MMTASTSRGVGIIGAGLIGHKRAASLTGDSRLVAVVDIDHARAEQLAHKHGAEVLSAAEDLVVVATTHDQLCPLGALAVEHGKHVLLEKPAAIGHRPLQDLAAAAVERNVIVRVGYNHRFHPSLVKAKSLVSSGDYGKLLWIRGRYGHGGRVGYETEWRADRARSGGGELLDQGSHLIDLVRFIAGDVDLAFAEVPTLFWPMTVEDNAFIALRPRCGGFAWLHASWSEWKNLFSFEITLAGAKIELTGLGGSYGVERLTLYEMSSEMGPPFATSWEWPFPDTSWTAEMDDVLAQIGGAEKFGADINDAVEVLRLIDEAYQ